MHQELLHLQQVLPTTTPLDSRMLRELLQELEVHELEEVLVEVVVGVP